MLLSLGCVNRQEPWGDNMLNPPIVEEREIPIPEEKNTEERQEKENPVPDAIPLEEFRKKYMETDESNIATRMVYKLSDGKSIAIDVYVLGENRVESVSRQEVNVLIPNVPASVTEIGKESIPIPIVPKLTVDKQLPISDNKSEMLPVVTNNVNVTEPKPMPRRQQAASIPNEWLTDYKVAYDFHVTTKKPLLIFFTMEGCFPCKEMEQNTWNNPDVLKVIQGNYVLCKLILSSETRKWFTAFGVGTTPTTIRCTVEPKTYRLSGYWGSSYLLRWLNGENFVISEEDESVIYVYSPKNYYRDLPVTRGTVGRYGRSCPSCSGGGRWKGCRDCTWANR